MTARKRLTSAQKAAMRGEAPVLPRDSDPGPAAPATPTAAVDARQARLEALRRAHPDYVGLRGQHRAETEAGSPAATTTAGLLLLYREDHPEAAELERLEAAAASEPPTSAAEAGPGDGDPPGVRVIRGRMAELEAAYPEAFALKAQLDAALGGGTFAQVSALRGQLSQHLGGGGQEAIEEHGELAYRLDTMLSERRMAERFPPAPPEPPRPLTRAETVEAEVVRLRAERDQVQAEAVAAAARGDEDALLALRERRDQIDDDVAWALDVRLPGARQADEAAAAAERDAALAAYQQQCAAVPDEALVAELGDARTTVIEALEGVIATYKAYAAPFDALPSRWPLTQRWPDVRWPEEPRPVDLDGLLVSALLAALERADAGGQELRDVLREQLYGTRQYHYQPNGTVYDQFVRRTPALTEAV